MCLNAVTKLREDLPPAYQSTKRQSDFEEYLILDRDNPSCYWNVQIYYSLGHSMLVATTTNETCVKPSMEPQAYKVFSTHAHEILGWKIIFRLLHLRAPNLGVMNGDVEADLSTLEFKN